MKAFPYTDVRAEAVEGCPGVSIRWLIGENVNAPNFATRLIELDPGSATEHHQHPWEHEVFVLEGTGVVLDADSEQALSPGSCVYVAPNETHNFRNTGDRILRFICVVPSPIDT